MGILDIFRIKKFKNKTKELSVFLLPLFQISPTTNSPLEFRWLGVFLTFSIGQAYRQQKL